MALGDLYEVIGIGDFNGTQVLQVWQYESLITSSDATDLATRFSNQVLAPMSPNLHISFSWDFVRARNLFFAQDDATIPSAEGGADNTSEALPIFNAVVIELFHDRPDIRNGRKSIAGETESHQASGILTANTITFWDGWLNNEVLPGIIGSGQAGLIYQPVVVQRIEYLTVKGTVAYRLPETQLEAQYGVVTGGATKSAMSTQNTRKTAP